MDESKARAIISATEDEHTERKRGGSSFNKEKLYSYIVSIANEKGGHIILGVEDNGTIVGVTSFQNIQTLKHEILASGNISRRLRVEIDEVTLDGKRVLIFTVPSRPQGEPISYKGSFLMRSGESLTAMNFDMIAAIREENRQDYSAEIVTGVTLTDLDETAIAKARELWLAKSGNTDIASMSNEEIVAGLELADDRGVTLAAIILLGKIDAITRYCSNSEIVWEYRKSSADIEFAARRDFKQSFLTSIDTLWTQIDARNDVAHIKDGFLIRDIPAFSEEVVREAVLNAVAHRDYQNPGSIYIRQSGEELIVESPGGFVNGVTAENIVEISSRPRNRRIAEAFQKLGLVERSGQGADKIFRETISSGKGFPDYTGSSESEVKLVVSAIIKDPGFVSYLEKVSKQTDVKLSVQSYILLEHVRRGDIKSFSDYPELEELADLGLVEKMRSGRYTKPILSKRYYLAMNKTGEYTRQRGIDYETKKAIILQHLSNYKKGYIKDIEVALSHSVKRSTLYSYLAKLRDDNLIEFVGNPHIAKGKNQGYWQLKKGKHAVK